MKITRQQLTQIINEEAKVAAEALGKQGFLKRMAGKVGLGTIKNFIRDARRVKREVTSFLEDSPNVWDNPRAATSHFRAYEDDISGWLAKLADYASATADQVPNKTQRTWANKMGSQTTDLLTRAAENADISLANRIKQDATDARRRADALQRDRAAAAKKQSADAWVAQQGGDREARRAADDRGAEEWRNDNRGMKGAFEENNKLTLSSLQQIVQEEIVKLNEEK